MSYEEELENRIEEVMREDCERIPAMRKKDYIVAAVFAGICLIGIVLGCWL